MHDGTIDFTSAFVNSNTDKFQPAMINTRSAVLALRGAITNLEQSNLLKAANIAITPPVVISGANPAVVSNNFHGTNPRVEPIKGSAVVRSTDDEVLKQSLRHSLHVSSQSVYFAGPTDLDSGEGGLLVGAYVHLDEGRDGDMRTILSNKAGGCDKSGEQYGVSLFINGWQTSDHQVYSEFGNEASGCNKVHTEGLALQLLKWFHVAVLHTNTDVVIYVDGRVVASQSLAAAGLSGHVRQTGRKFMIGQFEGGSSY